MQMKADMFYEGCQCFFVDIDYTKYESVEDYIGALALKPTVVYMSFSDNIYKIDAKQKQNPKYNPKSGIKSRRFRLCYVFSEIIFGKENFKAISSAINKMVEDSTHEVVQDVCGKNMSQYFNGSMNKEVYVSGCVYEITDFITNNTHTYYNESPKEGQEVSDIPCKLIEPQTSIKYIEASTSLVLDL